MNQTAGPAQSWKRRTVSMPRWIIRSCSAQTTTKQTTSRPEWPSTCVESWKDLKASMRIRSATIAFDAAEVCAPYQKQATMARTKAGMLAPQIPKKRAPERIGHAGLDAGVADQAHQKEDDERANSIARMKLTKLPQRRKRLAAR